MVSARLEVARRELETQRYLASEQAAGPWQLELAEAKLPYIVVLTDPTSGGVSASYAMLGDVHIAEPGAMIAFSGPRVIEQTIRESLPKGFQRAEFLREKGQVDIVVDRRKMKDTLSRVLSMLMPKSRRAGDSIPASLTAPKTHVAKAKDA